MKMLKKICFVLLLLATFSSVYGGSCFEGHDVDDCLVKAEQGDLNSQYILGAMYMSGGHGVPRDSKEAVKWYRLAAEQGNSKAQYNLGGMYVFNHKGVLQDYKEAVRWWRKSAEQGYLYPVNAMWTN
jgi:uncharacterized protein